MRVEGVSNHGAWRQYYFVFYSDALVSFCWIDLVTVLIGFCSIAKPRDANRWPKTILRYDDCCFVWNVTASFCEDQQGNKKMQQMFFHDRISAILSIYHTRTKPNEFTWPVKIAGLLGCSNWVIETHQHHWNPLISHQLMRLLVRVGFTTWWKLEFNSASTTTAAATTTTDYNNNNINNNSIVIVLIHNIIINIINNNSGVQLKAYCGKPLPEVDRSWTWFVLLISRWFSFNDWCFADGWLIFFRFERDGIPSGKQT